MKKYLVYIFFVSLIFSKEIKVALGDSLPPYIIPPSSGIEYEIIYDALELKGYKMKSSFVPFARLFKTVEQLNYDAVATVKEVTPIKGIYYSNEYITYSNVVISVAEYQINNLKDLKNKKIIAFQNATMYLGKEFENEVKNNKNYTELANQEAQVASLMNGRTEVIVIDENIFKYYFQKSKLFKQKPYKIYRIFSPTSYKIAFKDKKIRDDFNEGLKILKSNSKYKEVFEKYLKE